MTVPGNGDVKAALVQLCGVRQSGMDQEGIKGVSAVAAFLIRGMTVMCSRMQCAAVCFLNHRCQSNVHSSSVASYSFNVFRSQCDGEDLALCFSSFPALLGSCQPWDADEDYILGPSGNEKF